MQTAEKQLATQTKDNFSGWITGPRVKERIYAMMDGERGAQFVTSLVAAVNLNPALEQCNRGSILSAALQGAALNLSPSPSTGHFFMVPYGGKAQFQLGYKGMIQLAMRSGQYRHINALEIRRGEMQGWNPLTEELRVTIIEDDAERDALPVTGYVARFELLNGFVKTVYWSRARVDAHGRRYSMSFLKKEAPWQTNHDAMAKKTALRDLLGHWGPMSIEMETAYRADMAVIGDDGTLDYIDAPPEDGAMVGTTALPECPPERFDAEIQKWAEIVLTGKKAPGQIAAMASTKYALTEEQKGRILRLQTPPETMQEVCA